MNKDLKSIYDRSVKKPKWPFNPKKKPSIKPSILGSPCMRKIYYSYLNAPEESEFPLKNARTVKLGLAIGKMIADAFIEQGVAIKYHKPDGSFEKDFETGEDDFEFRVASDELQIRLAKIDLVVKLDDGLWLGEVKSINERGWNELRAPKPDHMIQGVTYLFLFNKMLREGKFAHIKELEGYTAAKGVRFFYYSKNSAETREYAVTAADQVFVEIVTKIQQVIWSADNDVLPEKTPDWCQSCTYRGRCAKNLKAREGIESLKLQDPAN